MYRYTLQTDELNTVFDVCCQELVCSLMTGMLLLKWPPFKHRTIEIHSPTSLYVSESNKALQFYRYKIVFVKVYFGVLCWLFLHYIDVGYVYVRLKKPNSDLFASKWLRSDYFFHKGVNKPNLIFSNPICATFVCGSRSDSHLISSMRLLSERSLSICLTLSLHLTID